MQAPPRIAELVAPGTWASVEFVSDLHLQAGEPATVQAWSAYMDATDASALFLLGDVFEAWVGDDQAAEPGFLQDCCALLQAAAARRPVFFMHGNRDFLVGRDFLRQLGVTLLDDPTVLSFLGRRWLLTHGDALCLADTAYLRFREQVRDADWQRAFLAKPLDERKAVGQSVRQQSQERKEAGMQAVDIDREAALAWLEAADAQVLLHGHTHRPGEEMLASTHRRIVLGDWDATAVPPRAEVLRIDALGVQRLPLAP